MVSDTTTLFGMFCLTVICLAMINNPTAKQAIQVMNNLISRNRKKK